jgi:hypothetical protein
VGPATRALLDVQATVRSWSPETGGSAVTDTGQELDLPGGLRLVGLRGLRPGQRVRLRSVATDGGPRVESVGLVTEPL